MMEASFQALLPSIEMHRGQFVERKLRHVNVERLALIDERRSVCGHVDNRLLGYLPDTPVEMLQIVRYFGHVLGAAIILH